MSAPASPELREHSVELPLSPDQTLDAVRQAAEAWGAEWRREGTGGRLTLPVTAGLRHGRLDGMVTAEAAGGASTRLRFEVVDSHYRLHWRAVVILLFGAFGAISFTLWPFFPPLLAIAPVALVLAFAAWFLVASKLSTAGPEDFLALVHDIDPG